MGKRKLVAFCGPKRGRLEANLARAQPGQVATTARFFFRATAVQTVPGGTMVTLEVSPRRWLNVAHKKEVRNG